MNVNSQERFRNFYNSLLNGGYDDYTILINAVYRSFQRSVELKQENSKNASPGRSVHNYAAGLILMLLILKEEYLKRQKETLGFNKVL